ncbi:MAG: hypothetical protein GEU28_15050 [Dehalococcoidia bacterium]|nr:hypothetical protein [Dehalococcoidia bacterium]
MDVDDERTEGEDCPRCGGWQDWETCWNCGGEGGRDLYEESPIEYPPGAWRTCDNCKGEGGYLVCYACARGESTGAGRLDSSTGSE